MAYSGLIKVQLYATIERDEPDKFGNYTPIRVPFPSIDKNKFDADKALNIVNAFDACFSGDLDQCLKVETSYLTP